MDEKRRPETVEGIRTLMLHPTAFWAMQSGDHQIMIETLLDAIDAQAVRIKDLGDALVMSQGQMAEAVDRDADQAERIRNLEARATTHDAWIDDWEKRIDATRQETATAIMREVTATSIDRWVLDSPPEKRWLLESTALDICRTHGAILEDPDGQ